MPIPGTPKLHRPKENVSAVQVSLSADDLRVIDDVLARMPVHGARYTEQGMELVTR